MEGEEEDLVDQIIDTTGEEEAVVIVTIHTPQMEEGNTIATIQISKGTEAVNGRC